MHDGKEDDLWYPPLSNYPNPKWIEHDGKSVPYDANSKVIVLFRREREGKMHSCSVCDVGWMNWEWQEEEGWVDIVAYFVVEEKGNNKDVTPVEKEALIVENQELKTQINTLSLKDSDKEVALNNAYAGMDQMVDVLDILRTRGEYDEVQLSLMRTLYTILCNEKKAIENVLWIGGK